MLSRAVLINGSSSELKPAHDQIDGKKFVCFFFAASFCPPCRRFTKTLKDFYETSTERDKFTIIYVSFDRNRADMAEFMANSHGPWWALPYNADEANALKKRFTISAIPSLIVCDHDLRLVTRDGVSSIEAYGKDAVRKWEEEIWQSF